MEAGGSWLPFHLSIQLYYYHFQPMPYQGPSGPVGYYNRNDTAALFFLLQTDGRRAETWQHKNGSKQRKKEEDAGRLLYVVVIPWVGEEDRTQ